MNKMSTILKLLTGGAIATAARARLAALQQPTATFNKPPFNEPAYLGQTSQNIPKQWPRARVNLRAETSLIPSVIDVISGPSRTLLAQAYPPQSDQPGSGFSVSLGGDGVADIYSAQIDPEMVTLDNLSLRNVQRRKDLGFGLAEAFKDRRLGSVPSAFVEQRVGFGVIDAIRGRFGR